ncbi:MAG: hypothetical protein ACLT33_10515 [Lachnospira pectinoschiza]
MSAGLWVGLNVWKFPYICGENGGAALCLSILYFAILGFLLCVRSSQ